MSQKVSVPVLPHVQAFMLQFYGKQLGSPIHVEKDSHLGSVFEGFMSIVPFEPPMKYCPEDHVMVQFILSDDYDSLTLTDRNRNLLGKSLNLLFLDMFGFAGACQTAITQNEHKAAKYIIALFKLEHLYEANSGRHVIVRRMKRIIKVQNRRNEENFTKKFRQKRTRKSHTDTKNGRDVQNSSLTISSLSA